jgi:hypothetical protein
MKTMFVIFSLLILTSCEPFFINIQEYEINNMDLDKAWTETSAFQYQIDKDGHSKTPIEFVADSGGDCEDFAIYMMYLLGPESSLIGIIRPSGIGHVIVKYHNQYLEPSLYGWIYDPIKLNIIIEYDYYEVMKIVTFYGARNLRII